MSPTPMRTLRSMIVSRAVSSRWRLAPTRAGTWSTSSTWPSCRRRRGRVMCGSSAAAAGSSCRRRSSGWRRPGCEPAAAVAALLQQAEGDVTGESRELVEGWRTVVQAYSGDVQVVRIRGREAETWLTRKSLSGNTIPRVALPRYPLSRSADLAECARPPPGLPARTPSVAPGGGRRPASTGATSPLSRSGPAQRLVDDPVAPSGHD